MSIYLFFIEEERKKGGKERENAIISGFANDAHLIDTQDFTNTGYNITSSGRQKLSLGALLTRSGNNNFIPRASKR